MVVDPVTHTVSYHLPPNYNNLPFSHLFIPTTFINSYTHYLREAVP